MGRIGDGREPRVGRVRVAGRGVAGRERGLERRGVRVVDRLRRDLPDVIAVYRFGSTARGDASDSSDVDLAVLTPTPIPPVRRFEVQEELAAIVGRDVDLVDLLTASPVLAVQVVAHGQLLFDGDRDARGHFEDRVFGAYARLNEERRGILERIAAEGSIYGR